MPADHRDNPVTRETVHRVYQCPEALRLAVGERRRALGQTLRAFIAGAVEGELNRLVAQLREVLPLPTGATRPARLPLSEPLLKALRRAGDETGLPASRLLLACLARAARRRRRRRGTAQQGARGRRGQRRGRPAADQTPAPAAGPDEKSAPEEPDPPAGEEEQGGLCSPVRLSAPA